MMGKKIVLADRYAASQKKKKSRKGAGNKEHQI
jgi:hypothetical protein